MPERDYQFSSIASTILDDAKQECGKCFETLAPVGGKLQTAWSIKHKLLQTMLLREEQRCLDGRVETDDAYLGGKKQGKRGRGAAGKTPFVAAIQTNNKGKPHFMCLTPVAGLHMRRLGSGRPNVWLLLHMGYPMVYGVSGLLLTPLHNINTIL